MTADTMSVPTTRRTTPDPHRSGSRPTRAIRASRPFHADREAAPTWMRVVGTALFVAGAGLSAAVLGWPGDAPEVALLVPGLLAVALGLLLVLARAGFTVTERHVTLHFRPLPPRRIARRRITDVRLVEADAARSALITWMRLIQSPKAIVKASERPSMMAISMMTSGYGPRPIT